MIKLLRMIALAGAVVFVHASSLRASDAVAEERQWLAAAVGECVEEIDLFIAGNPYGTSWREFLLVDDLRAQCRAGVSADRGQVNRILQRYAQSGPGLGRDDFERMQRLLTAWHKALGWPLRDELPTAARAAALTDPTPAGETRAQIQTDLRAAVERLGQFLKGSAIEDGWKHYLDWASLERIAADTDVTSDALDRVLTAFQSGAAGLQLPQFANVAEALRQRHQLYLLDKTENVAVRYAAQLERLASLAGLLASPGNVATMDEAQGSELIETLTWLNSRGLAVDLTTSVRMNLGRPNLLVRLGRRALEAQSAREISETGPFTDYVLGTSVTGTATSSGNIHLSLRTDPGRAAVALDLQLKTRANSVGRHPQAIVTSVSDIAVTGRKLLHLDQLGLTNVPATASATTSISITSARAYDSRGNQIARSRAEGNRWRSEAETSSRAEQRAIERLDRTVAETIQTLDLSQVGTPQRPVSRADPLLRSLAYRTRRDAIEITGQQGYRTTLGAPNAPPERTTTDDIAVSVHESLLNCRAAKRLAGKTVSGGELGAVLKEILGWQPATPTTTSDALARPWAVDFDDELPLVLCFAEGHCRVTLRGSAFQLGEDTYPGMEIVADYRLAPEAGVLRLVRDGKLSIEPLDEKARATKNLGARYKLLRKLLDNRFQSLLGTEISVDLFANPRSSQAPAKPRLTRGEARDGWLLMDYDSVSNGSLPAHL